MSMTSREQFEQAIKARFGDSINYRICKNSDGEYMTWDMQVAWWAWQAASKASEQQIAVAISERDAAVKAEQVWEKSMMEACGEDGPASVAAEIAALRAQRDMALESLRQRLAALAVENAGLKALSENRRIFIMNGVQLGYIKVPTVETDPALETIRVAVSPQEPTPATDAAIANIQAQGVEMFANHLRTNDNGASVCKMIALGADEFAAQLRQGAEHE